MCSLCRKKIERKCNSSNSKTSSDGKTEIVTPENEIISTDNLSLSLKKPCVCRIVHNEITMRKRRNYRVGLEGKFFF